MPFAIGYQFPKALGPYRAYTTRNIPTSHVERARALAVLLEVPLEEAINRALTLGLARLETATYGKPMPPPEPRPRP